MENLLLALFFLFLLVLVVGLISPKLVIRWGCKRTRGRVILTYGLTMIAFFVLFGLALPTITNEVEQKPEVTSSPLAEQGQPREFSKNEYVEVGKARWVVLEARDMGSVLKASESRFPLFTKDKTTTGKFIKVALEVENIGEVTETFIPSPVVIDNKEREFKSVCVDVWRWIPEGKKFFFSELHPGVPKQFILIYEVAKDATGLKLEVDDISFWGTETALIDLGL